MLLYVLVEIWIWNCSSTLFFFSNQIFGETLLLPQWMVAELHLTDPLPELAVGSVLELGVSRSESYIFERSHPLSLLRVGLGLLLLPCMCRGSQRKWKEVFSSYGISTCFKPHQTLCQILVAPKGKTKTEDQTGVVYHIPCRGCNKVYVGETKRTVGERY